MTQDEIIKLAKKAGWTGPEDNLAYVSMLERFYDLAIKPWAKQLKAERKRFEEYRDMTVGVMRDVRMDERKECAKIAESGTGEAVQLKTLEILRKERERIATAIRARGNNDQ